MKFYLTLLRREGRRLPSEQVPPARLVSARLHVVGRVASLAATCCFGGQMVAQLWDPVLTRVNEKELTFRGIELLGNAGVVQEWRIQPHCACSTPRPARNLTDVPVSPPIASPGNA